MHSRAQESGAQSPQPDSHAVCSAPLEQELVSQALAISWPDYLLNLESLSSVPSTHMPARTVAHVCCAVSVLTVLSMSNDELLIATGIPTARIPPRLFSKTYWGLPLKKKTVGWEPLAWRPLELGPPLIPTVAWECCYRVSLSQRHGLYPKGDAFFTITFLFLCIISLYI